MYFIDEFRIRFSIACNRFKMRLAELLVGAVARLDSEVLKNAIVGLKSTVSIQKYVPRDGKWHYFAMTLDCWIKREGKKVVKQIRKVVYIDGKKTRKRSKNR